MSDHLGYGGIIIDSEKAYTAVHHVLSAYFDGAHPDLDHIRYDYHRIRTMLDIALDYIRDIRHMMDEPAGE